jgi:hypothetical protein
MVALLPHLRRILRAHPDLKRTQLFWFLYELYWHEVLEVNINTAM